MLITSFETVLIAIVFVCSSNFTHLKNEMNHERSHYYTSRFILTQPPIDGSIRLSISTAELTYCLKAYNALLYRRIFTVQLVPIMKIDVF